MARILLVEDDAATREVVQTILRFEAHDLVLAGNALQARVLVKDRQPDIVLSDIHMPGANGMEFCRELRKDPDLADTYVILYTGFDTPETKTEALASGADDYLGKPLRVDDLQARIRLGLRIRGLTREGSALRRRLAEAGKSQTEMEASLARVKALRADLVESLKAVGERAHHLQDSFNQADARRSLTLVGEITERVDALRARVSPREEP